MNLAQFAKENNSKSSTASKSKDKKPRVVTNNPMFFDHVKNLAAINERMKVDKAQADILSEELKSISKEEWIRLYAESGKNPDSIMVSAQEGDQNAQVMFVPSDKYITINEERAIELREEYGNEVVEEETTFVFDTKMLDKYGEVLLNLILSSKAIDESDKGKLIVANTKYSVAKGTIDKLNNYGEIADVFENVRPVVSLKNVEVNNIV